MKLANEVGESKSNTFTNADIKQKLKELHVKKFTLLLNIIRCTVDVPVIFHFMGNKHFSS